MDTVCVCHPILMNNAQEKSPLETEGMWWGTLGSVRPFPNFKPERDVAVLQAALNAKDLNTITRILTNRSSAQRQTLARVYKSITQKELDASLKKVSSADLHFFLLGLLRTTEQIEAHRLRKAMEGAGTDEDTLLEILCVRSPQQLLDINATYTKEFQRDLEKDLLSESSGDFSKLLLALLRKEFREESVEQDTVTFTEELKNKKPGADVWIRTFTSRTPEHLRVVMEQLESMRGQKLEIILEERFGGILSADLRKGLKTLVRCLQDPHLFLAQRIQTMKGSVVQGVLLSHCEEDLLRVRVCFQRTNGTSLYSSLQKQFKAELQLGLSALCRAED